MSDKVFQFTHDLATYEPIAFPLYDNDVVTSKRSVILKGSSKNCYLEMEVVDIRIKENAVLPNREVKYVNRIDFSNKTAETDEAAQLIFQDVMSRMKWREQDIKYGEVSAEYWANPGLITAARKTAVGKFFEYKKKKEAAALAKKGYITGHILINSESETFWVCDYDFKKYFKPMT